eukprot:1878423-Karenia_brevis.AAC.1
MVPLEGHAQMHVVFHHHCTLNQCLEAERLTAHQRRRTWLAKEPKCLPGGSMVCTYATQSQGSCHQLPHDDMSMGLAA